MKSKCLALSLLFITTSAWSQTTIWLEDFSGYPNQTTQVPGVWTTVASDSDDGGVNVGSNFWGTFNGRFRCNDIEGTNNDDQNFLTTRFFDISGFSKVAVYGDYHHTGGTECGGPPSRDVIRFEYSVDGGTTWVEFETDGFICGNIQVPGTSSSTCIEGDSIALRVQISNKSNAENSYVDNLLIEGYNPPPVVFPGDTGFCGTDSVFLQASGGVSYQWARADSFTCDTCSGTYVFSDSTEWIILTAIDAAGCPNTDSIFLELLSPDVELGNDTSICPGENIVLDASTPQANQWLWSTQATSQTIQTDTPGTYWVEVQTSCGPASDTIVVSALPEPVAQLGNDTVICTAPWLFLVNAGFGNTFEWRVQDPTTQQWSAGGTTQQLTIDQEGQYAVAVTTICGTAYDTLHVNALLAPDISWAPDTTLCENEVLPLRVWAEDATYTWNNGQTDSILTVSAAGTYAVTVTNACGTQEESTTIDFQPLPTAHLNDTSLRCTTETLVLDAGNPGAVYAWSTGADSRTISITESGYYFVDITGCETTVRDELYVEYQRGLGEVQVPNVFTPNGDGYNDAYEVEAEVPESFESFEALIYNRWGKPVYETTDPTFQWDGTSSGSELEAGTYFVVIRYTDACTTGQETVIQESITLLK